MPGSKTCAVLNCEDPRPPMHRFPNPLKDMERYKEWVNLCGNGKVFRKDPNIVFKSDRVCHAHFRIEDHASNMYILKTCVPSLNLPPPVRSKSFTPLAKEQIESEPIDDFNAMQTTQTYEDSAVESKKKKHRCCVQFCNDFSSTRHHFPKEEPEIFEAWIKIIKPPGYDVLSTDVIYNKYAVCDIHFRDCDRVQTTCKTPKLSATAIPLLKIPGLDSDYAIAVAKEALERRDINCIPGYLPYDNVQESIAIEFADNYVSSYLITDSHTNEEFLLDETTASGLPSVNLTRGRMLLHLQMTEEQFNNQLKIHLIPKCGTCGQEAVGKSVIHCERGCQKPFHISCIEMPKHNFSLLKLIEGAMWLCSNCRKK